MVEARDVRLLPEVLPDLLYRGFHTEHPRALDPFCESIREGLNAEAEGAKVGALIELFHLFCRESLVDRLALRIGDVDCVYMHSQFRTDSPHSVNGNGDSRFEQTSARYSRNMASNRAFVSLSMRGVTKPS